MSDATSASDGQDDYHVRMYQDEVDTNPHDIDPVIPELTDDPSKELQVPPRELGDELDKIDMSNTNENDEDMREYMEDQDERDGDAADTDL